MKNYILRHRKEFIKMMIFILISCISAVFVQFFRGYVLDSALAKSSKTIYYASIMFLFIAIEILFSYFLAIIGNKFTAICLEDLRNDIFSSILSKKYKDFYSKDKGEYISKLINEVEIIDDRFFSNLCTFLEVSTKAILVLISIFLLNWKLAIISIFLMTLPLYVPKLIEKKLENLNEKYVESLDGLTSSISEYLSAFEVIHNFSLTKLFIKKFIAKNSTTQYDYYKMRKISSISMILSMILSYSSFFIVVIFSAYLVYENEFSAGEFFVAIGLIDQLSWPIISISSNIQDFISVRPVIKSLQEYINQDEIKDGKNILEKVKTIIFDNISFSYGEKELLKNINMEFQENKKYLIKGESGSGKTTLINLLLQLERVNSGHILANGQEYETEDILKNISVVRQDAFLFSDTLRNNISLYENIKDEKIIEILEKLKLNKFTSIEALDMFIENSGTNISGGEKKRIALARALVREKGILILDEPLANLDSDTVNLIEDFILTLNNITLIVISHIFSEEKIKNFDQVYTVS